MKKNRFIRASVWLLALTMLAMCAFAGNTTLAMYASSGSGTGTANVAGWSILVKGENVKVIPPEGDGDPTYEDSIDIALNDTFNINLFKTILCEGTEEPLVTDTPPGIGDVADTDETHVREGMIAPGTKGLFGLDVMNDSDVWARITVTVALDDLTYGTGADAVTVPLVFSGLGTGLFTKSFDLAPGASISDDADLDLAWAWPFEDESPSGSALDTPIGIAAKAANGAFVVSATVTIDAVQID